MGLRLVGSRNRLGNLVEKNAVARLWRSKSREIRKGRLGV